MVTGIPLPSRAFAPDARTGAATPAPDGGPGGGGGVRGRGGRRCARIAAPAVLPGPVRGGDYFHAIGSAGSCTLVLQTVLPALWFADGPSTLRISGGIPQPAAPPADFLIRTWQPLLLRMGVTLTSNCSATGSTRRAAAMLASTEPVAGLAALAPELPWRSAPSKRSWRSGRSAGRSRQARDAAGGQPAWRTGRGIARAPEQRGAGQRPAAGARVCGNDGGDIRLRRKGVPAETVADRAAREARLFATAAFRSANIWPISCCCRWHWPDRGVLPRTRCFASRDQLQGHRGIPSGTFCI